MYVQPSPPATQSFGGPPPLGWATSQIPVISAVPKSYPSLPRSLGVLCSIWAPPPCVTVRKLSPSGELEKMRPHLMISSFFPLSLPESSLLTYSVQLCSYVWQRVRPGPVVLSRAKAEMPTFTLVSFTLLPILPPACSLPSNHQQCPS